MLACVTEQVSTGIAGETLVVKATVPVKPFSGMTVIVEVTATFGVVLTIEGLANIWKSTTWTDTVAVWDSEPLAPVTVTV